MSLSLLLTSALLTCGLNLDLTLFLKEILELSV